MRQYIYESGRLGLDCWPSGTLRLEGVEETKEHELADVFVVPGSLALFRDPKSLYRLPYFMGNEEKHVFFDVSDYETQYGQPSMFIRCNLRPFNLASDPNSIQMAWPVEDYSECIPIPDGGFKYDISFQGWVTSHESRKISTEAVRQTSGLKSDLACYTDFCGYIYDKPEGVRRRKEFRRSMQESRIALCPESINSVFPYRFYESMSAARVPLLVGSDFVWPWENHIPYSEFCIVVPREKAQFAGAIALEFIRNHSDQVIIDMGKRARSYWEAKLDSRRWPELHALAVQEKIEELKQCA